MTSPAVGAILPEWYVRELGEAFDSEPPEQAWYSDLEHVGDIELLSLVVRPAPRGQSLLGWSGGILEALGGLRGIGCTGPRVWQARAGLDRRQCQRLNATLELGRRVLERLALGGDVLVDSFEAVASWARPRLAYLDHEQVWLLVLDGRNHLRSVQRIAQGGLHGCALTPADVLRPAVRDAGSAIVLVHNHPSGDPGPSPEDLMMTRRVADAAELLGVPLLDHVIVGRGGESSLASLGALDVDRRLTTRREPKAGQPSGRNRDNNR